MRRNIAVARSLSGGLLLSVFLSASPSVWAESFLDSLADHPLHTIRDADNTISLAATGTLQNYQENLRITDWFSLRVNSGIEATPHTGTSLPDL